MGDKEDMLLRILNSTLVGLGVAVCLALLILVGLLAYLKFIWAPAHSGLGAVAGGIYPVLWFSPFAFVAGFIWRWRRHPGK